MNNIELNKEIIQHITTQQAWHYEIVPKESNDLYIDFYSHRGNDTESNKEELELIFDKEIKFTIIPKEEILKFLNKYYLKSQRFSVEDVVFANYSSEDFLYQVINEANSLNCSDIHIEIYEENCRIRYRIDGKLLEKYKISKSDYPSFINKIKIRANIDIAEKRLPQDGRIFFTSNNENFDIRVSVLPTLFGEKIVLRLLSKDATSLDINNLGFLKSQLAEYSEAVKKPHGIILISGPTGSGKTTTLYATLKVLNKTESNILTIEDPIEYTLEGINQVQLKENIGLTYTKVLKTFLRQDPDIIMLGEIRDGETAQMAVRASLTGHLVLSTVHTNSAWGTISRLIDMGVPSYLLASTVVLTVAQRLVRLLCPHCKQKQSISNEAVPENLKFPEKINQLYTASGCEHCYYTGYKGRKAIYEVVSIDDSLSEMIKEHNLKIKDTFAEKGIKMLKDSAFELLKKGQTTLDEVYSILISSN